MADVESPVDGAIANDELDETKVALVVISDDSSLAERRVVRPIDGVSGTSDWSVFATGGLAAAVVAVVVKWVALSAMDVPGVCFEITVSREDAGCLDGVRVILGRSDGVSDIPVDGDGRSTADVVIGRSTTEVVSTRREVSDSVRLEDL